MEKILVQGIGDVASAVAHVLFSAGYAVVIHDSPRPAHLRRSMAFTDALFEGRAQLEGVLAKRAGTLSNLPFMIECHRAIPAVELEIDEVLGVVRPEVLVDARMRKHDVPEAQRGLAPLTIGLGPNFCAGDNTDIAIETSWGDRLGEPIYHGPTRHLGGEPSEVGGYRRARFGYSPIAGIFNTALAIGDFVTAGSTIGHVEETEIRAPLTGRLRGLSHDGAAVRVRTKIVEIDARAEAEVERGLGNRPRRIAEGVLKTLRSGGTSAHL